MFLSVLHRILARRAEMLTQYQNWVIIDSIYVLQCTGTSLNTVRALSVLLQYDKPQIMKCILWRMYDICI